MSGSTPLTVRFAGWGADLLRLVSFTVVIGYVGLFAWTLLPRAAGWQPEVILTGSMEPRIRPGDVVIFTRIDPRTIQPGQVAVFTDPARPGRTLTHRVVRVNRGESLVTRGDANPSADSTPVPLANVRGLARLRVPVIGLPLILLRDHRTGELAVVILLASIVLAGTAVPGSPPSFAEGAGGAGVSFGRHRAAGVS